MVKNKKRQRSFLGRLHKTVVAPIRIHHHPLVETEKHGNSTWVNLQDPHTTEFNQVAETYGLHPLHVHQTLNEGQVSQVCVEENYLFVLLYQPYVVAGEDKISAAQISMYIGKDFLVTVHSSLTPIPHLLFQELLGSNSVESHSSSRILLHLITRLLEDTRIQTESISVELDALENRIFDDNGSDAIEIGRLRQKITRLRRSIAAQKTVLEELHGTVDKFSHESLQRYYVSNTNISHRLWETIEEAKETIEIYKDADFTASTERTNEILAILTIIFTLAIPGTLLGTFYGMNVHLPGGVTATPWSFWGEYTTLFLIGGISILAAVVMYVWFKRKKWF